MSSDVLAVDEVDEEEYLRSPFFDDGGSAACVLRWYDI